MAGVYTVGSGIGAPGDRTTIGNGDTDGGAGEVAWPAGIDDTGICATAAGDVTTDDSVGGIAYCVTSSVLAGGTGRLSSPTMTVVNVDAEVVGPLPVVSANRASIRWRVAALEAAPVTAYTTMGTVPTTTTVAAAIAQQ